jgi:hypothetical protein
MKLIETTVSETTVRMQYADNADPEKATQWIDLQFRMADLKHGSGTPLPPVAPLKLAAIQAAALTRAQELIGEEMGRLLALVRQTT